MLCEVRDADAQTDEEMFRNNAVSAHSSVCSYNTSVSDVCYILFSSRKRETEQQTKRQQMVSYWMRFN